MPKCGPQDQSELEDRIDVVEFTSDTLSSHVAITGVVNVTLVVSSNVTDTDFVVKLTDSRTHPEHCDSDIHTPDTESTKAQDCTKTRGQDKRGGSEAFGLDAAH